MEASPLTLEELCMDKYVLLLEQFTRLCSQEECASQAIEFLSKLWWKNDYVLTEYLSEMLLRKMKHRGQCNNALLYLYSDFSSSRLRRVSLSKSDVTDEGLMYLRCQHLIELDVSHCKNITLRGLMQLLRCQPTLQVLKMSNLIFQDEDCSAFKSSDLESLNNIRKLDVSFSKLPIHFLRDIFRYMTKIVHLNLEGCYYTEQTNDDDLNDSSFNVDEYIGGVQALRNIEDVDLSSHAVADLKPLLSIKRTLKRLVLYNCVVDLDIVLEVVTQLENLELLDISKEEEPEDVNYRWKVGNKDLKLLLGLPNLSALDLSLVADFNESALECLHKKPTKLKFLGLTQTMSCHYQDIPADVVTGSSGEKQVLATLRHYTKRPKYIVEALADLVELYQDQLIQNVGTVIKVVMEAMEANVQYLDVVATGSVLLYHLTFGEDSMNKIAPVRNKLLDLVVSFMQTFPHQSQIQRTCCFILRNLGIPYDMDSHLEKIIHLLIQMCRNLRDDQSQGISVALLNSCVCYVNVKQKKDFGLTVVKIMLAIIKRKLDNNERGPLLNVAWSTLWNVTDETPANSRTFVENGGLVSFQRCVGMYQNDIKLFRHILGMMGNVVEVVDLQPHLMKPNIIQPIYNLLFNEASDLETHYNVCGIICHLAGCDETAWTLSKPSRDEALNKVQQEIELWDIKSERQMSYLSFKPLLRLLQSSFPPQTHHWVVWALRNFCYCDPKKYSDLVIEDGGIPLLEDLVRNPFTDERIAALAESTLNLCRTPVSLR